MDYDPSQGDPGDPEWELPRSWQEVRERWPHDYALRAVIGVTLVVAAALVFALVRYAG